jgi:prepilin-type N-terminal cleavage/methylation domain-containing protein
MLNRRSIQGFTLLEIIIVTAIIAFAVAVTYPALSRGTVAIHLRTTGRQVLNTMRYAREKAITEQKVMKVWADRESQKIMLTDEFGDGAKTYPMPKDVKIQRVAMFGQEIVDGPLIIRFLPNGSAEDAEIVLQSRNGGLLRVITDPITGGARILSPSGT